MKNRGLIPFFIYIINTVPVKRFYFYLLFYKKGVNIIIKLYRKNEIKSL